MHKWIARVLMVLALGGCDELADQQTEGTVLATLHGTLSLAPNVEPPGESLHVSVLWRNPIFVSPPGWPGLWVRNGHEHTPAACDDGQLTGWQLETPLLEQPVRVDTEFPSGFSVHLTEPPPPAALYEFPDGSGVSSASGDLVVYDDRNANGRLDPSSFDAMSPDLVYGSSQGATPWGIGQRYQYTIVYLTGDSEISDGDGKAGYSITTDESDASGVKRVDVQRLSEARIDLTLDPTHYVQQRACSVMCQVDANDTIQDPLMFIEGDLGTPVASDLGGGTEVWLRQDGDATTFSKASCAKRDLDASSVSYEVELSRVISEGCTQTNINQIHTTATRADNPVELPCAVVVELDESDFPADP